MSKVDSKKTSPDFSYETKYLEQGFSLIAGVDEAGRGPWAGPVVAGAVILDQTNIPLGLNDSKKLTEKKREALFQPIKESCLVGVGIVDAAKIDEINILQATMLAMKLALKDLSDQPDFVLIDGNRSPDIKIPNEAIKKGDAKSLSIAAASIIAKVTRDRMMQEYDAEFPQYGFAQHKGYGTAQHAQALNQHGPCVIHRMSFAPIKKLLTWLTLSQF